MRNKKIFKKGFTLIELLVVVAIISLLSSVVIASLNAARAKARDAKRVEEVNSLANAVALYQNDHGGNYPPDDCSWVSGRPDWSDTFKAEMSPYLSTIPKDPVNASGASRYCAFRITWIVARDLPLGADPTCDFHYALWTTLEVNNPALFNCGYTNKFFKVLGTF